LLSAGELTGRKPTARKLTAREIREWRRAAGGLPNSNPAILTELYDPALITRDADALAQGGPIKEAISGLQADTVLACASA
jgi:hypothetical protein